MISRILCAGEMALVGGSVRLTFWEWFQDTGKFPLVVLRLRLIADHDSSG